MRCQGIRAVALAKDGGQPDFTAADLGALPAVNTKGWRSWPKPLSDAKPSRDRLYGGLQGAARPLTQTQHRLGVLKQGRPWR